MHPAFEFLAFKLIKISGLLLIVEVVLSSLATGQAEISYKFWAYGQVMALLVLIISRIEGHKVG